MKFSFKLRIFSQNLLIFFIGACLLVGFRYSDVDAQDLDSKAAVSAVDVVKSQNPAVAENNGGLSICQEVSQAENPIETIVKTLASIKPAEAFSCKSENPRKVGKKINVIATAYSSTVWQTDSTPFITANGATVRDGIIANNMLAFGTQVRIPQLYGDKVFTVEDRMHWRKSNYQIDIWFPTLQQAVNFGAKSTYIEVLN